MVGCLPHLPVICFCFFSCCGPALLGFSETLPLVSVAAPSAFPPVCPLSVRVPWELPESFAPHLTPSAQGWPLAVCPALAQMSPSHHPWWRSLWFSLLSSELQPRILSRLLHVPQADQVDVCKPELIILLPQNLCVLSCPLSWWMASPSICTWLAFIQHLLCAMSCSENFHVTPRKSFEIILLFPLYRCGNWTTWGLSEGDKATHWWRCNPGAWSQWRCFAACLSQDRPLRSPFPTSSCPCTSQSSPVHLPVSLQSTLPLLSIPLWVV